MKTTIFVLLLAMVLSACAPAVTPASTATPITQITPALPATKVPDPTQAPVATKVPVPTATAAPTTTTAPTATPESRTEIGLWVDLGGFRDAGLFDDFKKEYPNILLKESAEGQDLTNLSPSTLTDRCVVEVQIDQIAEFIKSGKLADITGKVTPYLDKLDQNMLKYTEKDGKIYAMPEVFNPVVLYYRRDVMKEAGLSDKPEDVEPAAATWDSFLNMCKTIKDKTGRSCLFGEADVLYQEILGQQGLGYTDKDGKVMVDSPENIATLEKLGKFWKSGFFVNSSDDPTAWENIDSSISSFIAGSGFSGWMRYRQPETIGLWGVTRMPAMAAGQARSSMEPYMASLAIPEACKEKEAAWTFIQYMLGREDTALHLMDTVSYSIPALKIDENNPLFTKPDPIFAGQVLFPLYFDVARNIPEANIFGPGYAMMKDYVKAAVQKYANGEMSAADALKEAADQIRKQTGN